MFYHASQTPNITLLQPRVSNHNTPLIYFSEKRENVLVYLSNAVEKYCRETGFVHHGPWQKWGPYGFDREGRLQIQEYYPNALADTYQGVSGYIYRAEALEPWDFPLEIPHAAVSVVPVPVAGCEFVPDALEAILQAEREGLISILRYEQLSPEFQAWNRTTITIQEEYENAQDHPEYRHFLEGKFHLKG